MKASSALEMYITTVLVAFLFRYTRSPNKLDYNGKVQKENGVYYDGIL